MPQALTIQKMLGTRLDLLLLPDFIAIVLLVYVLLRVRGRRTDGVIGLWTVALFLILVEGASRIVYEMHTARAVHLVAHALALDAYGAAGAIFLLSASHGLRRIPHGKLFLGLNVLPHLMLFTAYGLDLHAETLYWAIAGCGLLAGLFSPLLLQRASPLYFAFAAIWAPLLLCIHHGDYRNAAYICLFFLYGISALFFSRSLPQDSYGKVAVVAGFSMWALCFLSHPWIATAHREWLQAASHLWDMQKFIITVGLLLVLLDDQVRSNEWLALHDGLTGLPNRRLFEDRLQHALRNAERTRGRLAVFMLDLDGFKQINDTLGHDAGDLLLKGVSNNLQEALRRSDTLARLGGDEFTLIAADLDGAPGKRMESLDGPGTPGVSCAAATMPQVQRILAVMSQAAQVPVNLGNDHGGHTISVSASIGVVIYPDEATTAAALLKLADQRMYLNKRRQADRRPQISEPVCSALGMESVSSG